MPTGVQITIGATAGSGGGDATLVAQFFLTGVSTRGSVTAPTIARSYSEFTDFTDGRTTAGSAHDAVRSFFAENEGTGRVVFQRVTGPGANTLGTVILKDRSTNPGLNTLTINAASPGSWSSLVTVVVSDGVLAGTCTIAVQYRGVTVETYPNLANPTEVVQALSISTYVRAVNLGSASVAPANIPLAGSFPLSAGADDAANVTLAQLTAGLAMFTPDYGPGFVAIPGQPASTTLAAALGSHCQANSRIAATSPAAGTTPASAVTLARTLRASTGARALGMVYPWVTLPADGEAGIRMVSPEGAYAGRRAAAIAREGVWQPPAGEFGAFQYVTGVEVALTAVQVNALVDDAIIPIVTQPSPRVYGDRSLSADEVTWRFLSYSDLVNAVAYDCRKVMDRYVGRSIDGLRGGFFASMLTDLNGALQPYVDGGGLVPQGGDPGYLIDLSANNASTISAGVAIADISLRPPSVAELIKIRLTKVGFTPAAA